MATSRIFNNRAVENCDITSPLYSTTKAVGLLEDGIPDSLSFIARLKSCVFNESKIKIDYSSLYKPLIGPE